MAEDLTSAVAIMELAAFVRLNSALLQSDRRGMTGVTYSGNLHPDHQREMSL
jgi:hypothetical protein